jgi:hypothetical protein
LLSRIALERPGVVTASTRLRSRPAAILGYRPAGSARCRTFNEIADGAPGLSRGLLSKRLRDLERAGPGSRSWLLIERGDAEICEKHPGGDEDLVVSDQVALPARILESSNGATPCAAARSRCGAHARWRGRFPAGSARDCRP